MTSLIFTWLPIAAIAIDGKAPAVQMAASTVTIDVIEYSEVTLIDSDDNKAYRA